MMILCVFMVFHAPIDGNCFNFQRMDDKAKDRLVLSVIWHWRDTYSSLGLCFSFGHAIKGGMT